MNDLINLYMNYGVSLYKEGLNTVLIPLRYANNALMRFKEFNLVVSGGDIFHINKSDKFEHTYDNWFYEGNSSADSIRKAITYLEDLSGDNLYVSFVFKS